MITQPDSRRVLLLNLALTGIYFLLGMFSLLFATTVGNITLIWLPGGLALAVLLLGGLRYVPSIFLGAFAAGIAIGDSIGVSAGLALGNTLEPLLGWWLLTRRVPFDVTLTKLRDFFMILFFAAPLSVSVSAVVGMTTLLMAGIISADHWLSGVLHWWMADVLGIILLTPLIAVWRAPLSGLCNIRTLLIKALPVVLAALAGQIIFLAWFAGSLEIIAKGYLMFFFISWVAIKLGARGVTIVLAITATQALFSIYQGIGYFGDGSIDVRLINFWFYMLTLSVVGMTITNYISERKQVELALQESESRFRGLLQEISSVAVQSYGADGTIHYWNKASEQLYGYSSAEAIGQNIVELIFPPDSQDNYRQAMQLMFVSGQPMPAAELSLLHKNTLKVDIFSCHSYVQVLGRPPEVFCIGIDITERKRMEKKLVASEGRARSIVDVSPVPMVLMDKENNITFLNPAFQQLFGYNVDDLKTIDDWWLKAYPNPAYRQSAQLAWQAVIEKGGYDKQLVSGTEFDVRCKSGEVKSVLISVSAIEKTLSMIYLVVFLDMTDYKRCAEQAQYSEILLDKKEGYQQALFDNFPFMVWFKDTNGRFLVVNQVLSKALNINDPEQMIGKSDFDFYPTDLAQQHQQEDIAVLSSREKKTVEEEQNDPFGITHWFETYKAPVIDSNGDTLGIVGFSRDITERKKNESDLRIAATAFESQDGMFVTDANRFILRVNRAFTAITGYTSEEVIGQTPMLFNAYHQDDSFYAELWDCIFDAGAWQGEIWTQRKNGDIYLAWLMVTPVKDNQGVVTHYVTALTDITVRKEAEEQIKEFAFYDSLTHLPNRRKLLERLDHSIASGIRENSKFAVLMLDLDRFKAVNDSFGHLAGDELLQQVASRITKRIRNTDMVARLGGDEFVVLLSDITHKEDAARVANMIVADLNKPFHLGQHDEVHIGTSIGISLYPEHGDLPELLMDNADVALYQAKNNGRGCFAYFSEGLTLATRQRLQLETKLRRGIAQQELRLFYQPQIDIITGEIIGAEALVRWQGLNELMLPGRFIPIAEETSLILDIGAWVLYETCRQGQLWQDAGFSPIILSVNVSAAQIKRSNMVALISDALVETGFSAAQLELEITERSLMEHQDVDFIVDTLNNLHALGIRLAIDNFGTGYTSLAHLQRFPVDLLKIDRSFINAISQSQDNMGVASTIIMMGHNLGFKVLAEGVETQEQITFLREKGCDFYQGYVKSKPLPAAEFTTLLREHGKMTKPS